MAAAAGVREEICTRYCTHFRCGSVGYIAGAWGFGSGGPKRRNPLQLRKLQRANWLRGLDLNQRPSGYEPDEM